MNLHRPHPVLTAHTYTGGICEDVAVISEEPLSLGDFSALLATLFASLIEETPWEAFLRALAKHLEASFAVLMLTANGAIAPDAILVPGGDPQISQDYAARFSDLDPFVGLPEGKVTAFSEFVRKPRDGVFWREFLQASGGDQVLGVNLHFENGLEARLRITRDASRPDFSTSDRERLQLLVPHIRTALELFKRLQVTSAEHSVYRGIVERMGVAAIILDLDGKVFRTNGVADRLLAMKDGIGLRSARLVLGDAQQDRALSKLLEDVAVASEPASLPALRFRLERPSGLRDLNLVAKPVAAPVFLRNGGGAAVAIFINDCGHEALPDPEAIREIFQLTRMEAQLAAVLACGCSLVQASDKLGITHNTVRAHLRSIFMKTGVHRQSQLIHLLHASMPELAAGASPRTDS